MLSPVHYSVFSRTPSGAGISPCLCRQSKMPLENPSDLSSLRHLYKIEVTLVYDIIEINHHLPFPAKVSTAEGRERAPGLGVAGPQALGTASCTAHGSLGTASCTAHLQVHMAAPWPTCPTRSVAPRAPVLLPTPGPNSLLH